MTNVASSPRIANSHVSGLEEKTSCLEFQISHFTGVKESCIMRKAGN